MSTRSSRPLGRRSPPSRSESRYWRSPRVSGATTAHTPSARRAYRRWSERASDLDAGTDDHGLVQRQAEVAGGVGGDVGRRDEQPLTPWRHRRLVTRDQLEVGQEVRSRFDVDVAFGVRGVEQAQRGRNVRPFHVPIARADVDDAVPLVAELVNRYAVVVG